MGTEKAYCPACKTETAPLVKPVFRGFQKVGETRTCPFCGHELTQAGLGGLLSAVPAKTGVESLFGDYRPPGPVNPFGEEPLQAPKTANPFGGPVVVDRPVNPFGDLAQGAILRICRNCRSYVVNPYTQKCMLHEREVTATDTCDDFSERARG
jgi:hypothetical protein